MASGTQHQLDNPIWQALTSCQSTFAEISDLARRFPVEVTTLSGFLEPTPESYASLASLLATGETAALFLESFPAPPAGWTIIETAPLLQMVYEGSGTINSAGEVEELNEADVSQMQALAELTRPGPFGKRTRELGTYLGIRRHGRLAAMAGERLHVPGYTEVSAVCTHPEYLGGGYASVLVAELIRRICNRGEVPFLHVRQGNTRAVELYARLGFKTRIMFHFTLLGWGQE